MQTTLPPEIAVLVWGCVLAFVHIVAAVQVKTRQYGAKWNMSARDEEVPPLSPLAGRLARAQANFFETFPILIAGIIIVSGRGLTDGTTALGAWIWLGARVAYLPLYAFGVPVLRSLAWAASLVGIVMVLKPALALLF